MSEAATSGLEAIPPMVRRVRAYFAPVDRTAGRATLFDAAAMGGFDLDQPPRPWIDLGWVEHFRRKSESVIVAVESGRPAMPLTQVRKNASATLSFCFKSWSKLAMALASGSQQMNLLQVADGAEANGSGGRAAAASDLLSTSTANSLELGNGAADGFAAGGMVAVDADYRGETGFVGSGIGAAYVRDASSIRPDADYIRRVTLNVARIASVAGDRLELETPLIAGAPVGGMKVQGMCGFVDREGGTFFQEWSGLFVMAGEQGERILFHYPRLQACSTGAEAMQPIGGALERVALAAAFRALPVTDANDGERVACYRSFLPAGVALL